MHSKTVRVSLLVALCGLACGALAQEAKPAKAAQPVPVKAEPVKEAMPGQPAAPVKPAAYTPTLTTKDGRVEFTVLEHNFGVISDDTPMDAAFSFKNTGAGALEITNMQGSCGCTVGALDKRVYQPGESGTIKVTFNPHGKKGPQHTTVTVYSNDETKPQVVLNIKSEIKPLVAIEPQFAVLNQIAKGKGGKTTVTVTSRLPGLQLINATPSVSHFEAKILPATQVEINGEKVTQWPVEVSVRPDAPVGPVNCGIQIRTSDASRTLSMNANGEVVGDVQVTPQRVQMAALMPGQPYTSQMVIKSRNGLPFNVLKIEEQPSTPGMAKFFGKITVTEDATTTPKSYTVSLAGQASSQPGSINGNLVIFTDLKGEEQVRVPFFGYIRADQPKAPAPASTTRPNTVWDENPSSLVPGPR